MNSIKQKEKPRIIFDEFKLSRADEILNTIDSNLNTLLFQGTPKDIPESKKDLAGRKKNSFFGHNEVKDQNDLEMQGGSTGGYLSMEKSDWEFSSGKASRENTYGSGIGGSPYRKEFINIIENEDSVRKIDERPSDSSSFDFHENLRLKTKVETLERDNKKKAQELKETRQQLDSILNKEIQTNKQNLSASGKKKYNFQSGGPGSDLFTDNSNILNRMEKLEEFYKNKIKIIEERKKELEEDVKRLENEKALLINVNEETKKKLQKYLEEMEESYKKEILEKISKLEDQMTSQINQVTREKNEAEDISNAKISGFKKEIDQLKRLIEDFERKVLELSENNKTLEEEKADFNDKYNQLMMIHNNMIELDLKKNEKALQTSKVSTGQRSQNIVANSSDHTFLSSGAQEQGRFGVLSGQNEEMLGILNYYKSEIEKIKDYNEKIKTQYFTDMSDMKKNMRRKERENELLKSELNAMKGEV